MENFKEFKGKTLDDAIEEACAYFQTEREKLEIEIVQDAKTGIFGIVGARKATVRARRMHLREAVQSILGGQAGKDTALSLLLDDDESEDVVPAAATSRRTASGPRGGEAKSVQEPQRRKTSPSRRSQPHSPAEAPVTAPAAPTKASPADLPSQDTPAQPASPPVASKTGENVEHELPKATPPEAVLPSEPDTPMQEVDTLEDGLDSDGEGLPTTPLEHLDASLLQRQVAETVRQLVRPLVDGEAPVTVRVAGGRVQASIDVPPEAADLLVGRDGLTLLSLQYMASRIVSHSMNAAVRVQLDAGAYRHRQDEKVREMALALAERVRQSGHSCSTRPLSSYHRRIVHMCLQDIPELQTRSIGDGPLKRVIIMRRRGQGPVAS